MNFAVIFWTCPFMYTIWWLQLHGKETSPVKISDILSLVFLLLTYRYGYLSRTSFCYYGYSAAICQQKESISFLFNWMI
jgi:hypothetical protein